MPPARLTRDECQLIAERILASLDDLSAARALARFGDRHVDEVAIDEPTGKPYRRIIFVSRIADQVMLSVSVTPEPRLVRHARRFTLLADLIEGWRSEKGGSSYKVLPAVGADSDQTAVPD